MLIPIRNLKASNDKNNFENYLGTATKTGYEYRVTGQFSNKRNRVLPQSGCVPAMLDTCCTSSVATPVAPVSSNPSLQRRSPQSLLSLRLRFGIKLCRPPMRWPFPFNLFIKPGGPEFFQMHCRECGWNKKYEVFAGTVVYSPGSKPTSTVVKTKKDLPALCPECGSKVRKHKLPSFIRY